jgi:hypothetical protein
MSSPVPTVRLKDCPNCGCHLASVWCDGCDMTLCVFCYDEHENNAPCHVCHGADCDWNPCERWVDGVGYVSDPVSGIQMMNEGEL